MSSCPFHALRVAAVEQLCDDAAAVTFEVPGELQADFAFRPGQSVTLRKRLGGMELRRSYSICAPVGAQPRIGVREIPGGIFSGWLVHGVRIGDEIEVQPPSGRFVADPDTAAKHVLIAAGSGITPILSIVSSVLRNPGSTATVFYGNRRASSVMFLDELSDLKDSYRSRLELVHVLSREFHGAELLTGRLDAERIGRLLESFVSVADIDHYWLCGPFEVVVGAQKVLHDMGIPGNRIHRELFFVEDVAPRTAHHLEPTVPGPTSEVTVVLDGRSSTLTLPRDRVILDSAQESRDDLPFACKGGVCGTCRAKVTTGEVDMRRNFALETSEIGEGFVLTCQTFPVSETVTVDFDA